MFGQASHVVLLSGIERGLAQQLGQNGNSFRAGPDGMGDGAGDLSLGAFRELGPAGAGPHRIHRSCRQRAVPIESVEERQLDSIRGPGGVAMAGDEEQVERVSANDYMVEPDRAPVASAELVDAAARQEQEKPALSTPG